MQTLGNIQVVYARCVEVVCAGHVESAMPRRQQMYVFPVIDHDKHMRTTPITNSKKFRMYGEYVLQGTQSTSQISTRFPHNDTKQGHTRKNGQIGVVKHPTPRRCHMDCFWGSHDGAGSVYPCLDVLFLGPPQS